MSSLIKTDLPTKFLFVAYCLLQVCGCCLLILNIMWNWLVILFYQGKNVILSKQIVLSSSKKMSHASVEHRARNRARNAASFSSGSGLQIDLRRFRIEGSGLRLEAWDFQAPAQWASGFTINNIATKLFRNTSASLA